MPNVSFSINSNYADPLERKISVCSDFIEISEACIRSRTDSSAKEQIQQIFQRSSFDPTRFHVIEGRIYQLAGRPQTDDPEWGKHHALDDLPRLQRAIAELAVEQFQQSSPEDQHQIEERILENVGRPITDDVQWDKHHAKDDPSILLCSAKQHLLHVYNGSDEISGLKKHLKDHLKNGSYQLWMEEHREKLAAITDLDLSRTNLSNTQLSELTNYFPNLECLNLSNNQLTELPKNFGSNWQSLERLYLHENQLIQLPENFGSSWQNLEKLYLNYNQLAQLPENFGSSWQNLKKLCLGRNRLTQLPENFGSSWQNLKSLYLYNNQLTHLFENFGDSWQNLKTLS